MQQYISVRSWGTTVRSNGIESCVLSKPFFSSHHHTAVIAIHYFCFALLLLYPVQPLYRASKLFYFACSLTSMEVTGILSSEVLSDKEDMIRILVTVTWEANTWTCRRNNARTEELHGSRCRNREQRARRVRRQHKNHVVFCFVHIQCNFFVMTLFMKLPQEFLKMVTKKKMTNSYGEFQLNIQALCHCN